jgi:UDP-N-acetyl-D-mannosaminuronate dehydrogenase
VDIADAKVAVPGYAYRENSDDTRNSPSEGLVGRLRELGAEVVIHDPYVFGYQNDLQEMVQGCDAVILMAAHDAYCAMNLSELRMQVAWPILMTGATCSRRNRPRQQDGTITAPEWGRNICCNR